MQLLFLLLLLANLAILASPQLASHDIERDRHSIAQAELGPYKVRIIGTPAVDGPRVPPSYVVAADQTNEVMAQRRPISVCLQWAGISAQDAKRSQAVLDALGATYRVTDEGGSSELHWVYIPALSNQAAVDNLAAQLKAEGEYTFTVSRQQALDSYYISLGVFRSAESAKRQQMRFQKLGAVIELLGTARTTYIVDDGMAVAEKVAAAAEQFEQTTVKLIECPEVRTS